MKKPLPLLTLAGLFFWSIPCNGQPKDFDVVPNKSDPVHGIYSSFDPNGLPLNPKWGQQARDNTLPDPYVSCPASSYTLITDPFFVFSSDDWTASHTYPSCTSVHVTFNGGALCGPHVNFANVTYEGFVTWDKHSGNDDDYDLDVRRADAALYSTTSGGRVDIEFDSDETVDNWDDTNTWWNDFHHKAVDHFYYDESGHPVYDGDVRAAAMINGSRVILIGELGMDTSHRAKTEIHPVYAMFVQVPETDSKRSSWAFFVRNWGDEGFCSDGDQPFETEGNQIKVHIPNVAGELSENLHGGAQNADDDELAPLQASMQPSGDGVLLTFTLLRPAKQSWIVGDYSFVVRRPERLERSMKSPGTTPPPRRDKNPSEETESEERLDSDSRALQARIDKLPADSRIELYRKLQYVTPRKKSSLLKTVVLFEPAKDKDVHPSAPAKTISDRKPRPSGSRASVDLRRQKKIDFIKQFLAEREQKTPPAPVR
jgi:hypothetical protein